MVLPIVLLPGLDGTGDLFVPLVAAAPVGMEPIVVRFPDLSAYADLLGFIGGQLPPGKFVILGESFSGPLAVQVARAAPERVVAVVLCNSFTSPPITRFLRYLPWELLFVLPPPRWVIRWLFVGANAAPLVVSAVRQAIAKTPRRVLAARMRAVFGLPRRANVEEVDVPILCLSGTHDLLVPFNSRSLSQWGPGVTCKQINGPHLLLQVEPVAAWAEISAFLRQAG